MRGNITVLSDPETGAAVGGGGGIGMCGSPRSSRVCNKQERKILVRMV